MKKLITYTLASLLLIVSCRKGDNPKLPTGLEQIPAPLITIDPTGDATIAVQTADAFNGKFKVSLYFPNGAKPAKFDIVVEKNGDPTMVKTLDANVTTFPSSFSVSGLQLHNLFGAAIVLGDKFSIGANVTTADGKFYPAFPATGTAYGSGILSAPGFSPAITFGAVCKFIMTDYGAIGSTVKFNVITDDWDPQIPYPVPATVSVTIIDATHLSFVYGPANASVVVTVNPVNNTTSVATTVIGDYGPVLPYGNVSVSNFPSADNYVLPCSLILSIEPEFTVSAGSFGTAQLVLQAQ